MFIVFKPMGKIVDKHMRHPHPCLLKLQYATINVPAGATILTDKVTVTALNLTVRPHPGTLTRACVRVRSRRVLRYAKAVHAQVAVAEVVCNNTAT